jgi:hypothetical protein
MVLCIAFEEPTTINAERAELAENSSRQILSVFCVSCVVRWVARQ